MADSLISYRARVGVLLLIAAYSLFLPKVEAGGVWIGLDDFVALIYGGYFFTTRLSAARLLRTDLPVLPLVAFVLVYVVVGAFQAHAFLGALQLPTELWQFLKRALVFCLAAELFFRANYADRIFLLRILLSSAFAYLLFGVAQYFFGGPLIELYARTEDQQRLAQNVIAKRLFGVAGHSNAWGGVCFVVFMLIVTIGQIRGVIESSLLRIVVIGSGFFLLLFNATFSGSRSALFAGFAGLVSYAILKAISGGVTTLVKVVLSAFGLLLLLFVVMFLWSDQVEFILFRFEDLQDKAGGGRVGQIERGMWLVNGVLPALIGVSNVVQRTFGVSHGIEVEPVNLFVNYGLLGVLFIYSSYFLVAISLFRLRGASNYGLFAGVTGAIIFAVFFSLGFFVFQELIVGIYLWLFMGAIYGYCYKVSKESG